MWKRFMSSAPLSNRRNVSLFAVSKRSYRKDLLRLVIWRDCSYLNFLHHAPWPNFASSDFVVVLMSFTISPEAVWTRPLHFMVYSYNYSADYHSVFSSDSFFLSWMIFSFSILDEFHYNRPYDNIKNEKFGYGYFLVYRTL